MDGMNTRCPHCGPIFVVAMTLCEPSSHSPFETRPTADHVSQPKHFDAGEVENSEAIRQRGAIAAITSGSMQGEAKMSFSLAGTLTDANIGRLQSQS